LKETGIEAQNRSIVPEKYVRARGDLSNAELDTLDLVVRHGLRRAEAAAIRGCTAGNIDKQLLSARKKLDMQQASQIAFAAEVARLGVLPRIGPREVGGRYNMSTKPFKRPAPIAGPRSMSGGRFSDYLERLNRCTTQEQVAAVLYASAQEFGVEHYMLGAWSYQSDTGNPGPSLLTSYGEDWLKDLRAERYKADPILAHAQATKDVFSWEDVPLESREELRFMCDADDAIGAKGVSGTTPGPAGLLGAFSFSSRKGFDVEAVKERLFARSAAAHLRIIDINFKAFDGPDFTDMEMRILQELWTDRTRAEIAERFGIAESTIRTHVKHIYQKLQVSREATAIREAFYGGRITLPDWGK